MLQTDNQTNQYDHTTNSVTLHATIKQEWYHHLHAMLGCAKLAKLVGQATCNGQSHSSASDRRMLGVAQGDCTIQTDEAAV